MKIDSTNIERFVVTADWHFSSYTNDKIISESGRPERFHNLITTLQNVANYCKENNISYMIVPGDLLHNKSIIYTTALNALMDFFELNQKIHFIIIDGNHDLSGRGEESESALRSIGKVENITWITEPILSGDIFFVPWKSNMVDTIKKSSAKILVSHFGLNEAQLSSGISLVSDVKLSDLINKYQYVFLGHYHKPQEIIRDEIQVWYCGSIIQLHRGERDENKRFLDVTRNGDLLDIVSVETSGYSKYFEFEINQENKDEVVEKMRQLKSEGHHVFVKKIDPTVDTNDLDGEFVILDKTVKDITDRGITAIMSTEDKLKNFMRIKKIPEDVWNEYLKEATIIIERSNSGK